MKSRPGRTSVASLAITAPRYNCRSNVASRAVPAKPRQPSHVADRLTGFCRFGDGLKSSDGVENLFRPDRIGCNTGDCVGEGFEVGLDRVDRRKAQMLRFLTAAPQYQIGPSERLGRGLAAKGM